MEHNFQILTSTLDKPIDSPTAVASARALRSAISSSVVYLVGPSGI